MPKTRNRKDLIVIAHTNQEIKRKRKRKKERIKKAHLKEKIAIQRIQIKSSNYCKNASFIQFGISQSNSKKKQTKNTNKKENKTETKTKQQRNK